MFKVFPGNYDPGTVVKHSLKFNLIIKHFRFYILTWYGPEIRFRVELYGGTGALFRKQIYLQVMFY